MNRVKPVHIDGALYALIGVFGAMQITFSSDAAYKYILPDPLFWMKAIAAWGLAGATSLKTYRSLGYANSLKNGNGNGTPPLTPPPADSNLPKP